MSNPPQSYLRSLPDEKLQSYVAWLEAGDYSWRELWDDFNRGQGYYGSGPVFRLALTRAGMTKVNTRVYRKTEFPVIL